MTKRSIATELACTNQRVAPAVAPASRRWRPLQALGHRRDAGATVLPGAALVRVGLLAALLVALLVAAPAAVADELANEFCPVMSESPASADIKTVYHGKTVNFCCTACAREFVSNPKKYLAALPQFGQLSMWEETLTFLQDQASLIAGGVLAALLIVLRIMRGKITGRRDGKRNRVERLFTKKITPTVPLLVLVAVLAFQLRSLYNELFFKYLEEEIHYATFYDHGYPPVPKKPYEGSRLGGTSYRGNDERSEVLYNGGNYRTATFFLSLVNESGEKIEYGDDVAGQSLFVRYEAKRPEFTPNFLYSDRFIKAMFLTQECSPFLGYDEPVADRVDLTTIEPMERWEARFPIGKVPDEGSHRMDGVIYVCEEQYYRPHRFADKTARGGARFHYGIPYDLVIEDGKLSPESDLYINSLYRTRKFPLRTVPFDQWFSQEPIPLLPHENTDDPVLLGIEDYID